MFCVHTFFSSNMLSFPCLLCHHLSSYFMQMKLTGLSISYLSPSVGWISRMCFLTISKHLRQYTKYYLFFGTREGRYIEQCNAFVSSITEVSVLWLTKWKYRHSRGINKGNDWVSLNCMNSYALLSLGEPRLDWKENAKLASDGFCTKKERENEKEAERRGPKGGLTATKR